MMVTSKYFKKVIPKIKRKSDAKRRSKLWKLHFFQKDRAKCLLKCGSLMRRNNAGFSEAHVVPFSSNPEDVIWNLLPICTSCNTAMGETNLITWVLEAKFIQVRLNMTADKFQFLRRVDVQFNNECSEEGKTQTRRVLQMLHDVYKHESSEQLKLRDFVVRYFFQKGGVSRDVLEMLDNDTLESLKEDVRFLKSQFI